MKTNELKGTFRTTISAFVIGSGISYTSYVDWFNEDVEMTVDAYDLESRQHEFYLNSDNEWINSVIAVAPQEDLIVKVYFVIDDVENELYSFSLADMFSKYDI